MYIYICTAYVWRERERGIERQWHVTALTDPPEWSSTIWVDAFPATSATCCSSTRPTNLPSSDPSKPKASKMEPTMIPIRAKKNPS